MREYFVWLFKLLTLVVIIFVVVPVLLIMAITASTKELSGTVSAEGDAVVSVVELTGMIETSKDIVKELYQQIDNEKVIGVVLRINSPGGAVAPSQDIYSAVRKLKERKPIVASMESLAASGGLYAAVAASKVYAEPGTLTGSIGVIMQVPNFSKITEKVGVEVITIKSGQLKDIGNTFRDMTPEERAFLETSLGIVHDQFIAAIAEGRGLDIETVRKFADGRVLLGSQAKELKLVDEYGDLYDAARAVHELAGKPLAADKTPELYYPMDRFGEIRKYIEGALSFRWWLGQSGVELRYVMP